MDRDTVIARLQAAAPELKARGVAHLSLFGSVARGQANAASDIDLAVDFDDRARVSLLDQAHLTVLLSDLLGRPVDLLEERAQKPRIRHTIARDRVVAF
ncbi:MAG: nucleotidyltransferase domain-containing protein [Rhodospirillaceae bacterium]|nr:nucleotidyltransferase domain-containing protein [Rhodospirillaceae bacterium]